MLKPWYMDLPSCLLWWLSGLLSRACHCWSPGSNDTSLGCALSTCEASVPGPELWWRCCHNTWGIGPLNCRHHSKLVHELPHPDGFLCSFVWPQYIRPPSCCLLRCPAWSFSSSPLLSREWKHILRLTCNHPSHFGSWHQWSPQLWVLYLHTSRPNSVVLLKYLRIVLTAIQCDSLRSAWYRLTCT